GAAPALDTRVDNKAHAAPVKVCHARCDTIDAQTECQSRCTLAATHCSNAHSMFVVYRPCSLYAPTPRLFSPQRKTATTKFENAKHTTASARKHSYSHLQHICCHLPRTAP